MRKLLTVFTICIFVQGLSLTSSFSEEIYRWVDDKGVVHFSDTPTDKAEFKAHEIETIQAYDYVEPASQAGEENEEKTLKNKQPQQNEITIYKQVHEAEEKNDTDLRGNYTYVKRRPLNKLSRGHSVVKNRVFPPATYKGYDKTELRNDEYNAKIKSRNLQIQKENEAKRLEYEKERKKVERYNAQVDEYNAQPNNEVESRNPFREKKVERVKYGGRKPYLGDDDPNRPFYRRHPLNR